MDVHSNQLTGQSFQDVCESNHYAVHFKLTHCCVNYISIKPQVGEKAQDNSD